MSMHAQGVAIHCASLLLQTSESKLAWPTTPPSPALASTLTRRTGGGNEGSAALSSTLTRRTGGDNDGPAALSSTLTRQRPEAPQASEPALPTPPAVAPNPFIPPPLMVSSCVLLHMMDGGRARPGVPPDSHLVVAVACGCRRKKTRGG